MSVSANFKYSKDHEWVKVEGDDAIVGITDFAQSQLGDIVFVDITTVGETVAQGEVFGSIEAVKTVSDMVMPVSGEILEFNEDLDTNPALINENPFEGGWIVRIKMSNSAELDTLMSAEEYKVFIG